MKTLLALLLTILASYAAVIYSPSDPRSQKKVSTTVPPLPKVILNAARQRGLAAPQPAARAFAPASVVNGVIYRIAVTNGTLYLYAHQAANTELKIYRCDLNDCQPDGPWQQVMAFAECSETAYDWTFQYVGLTGIFPTLFFKGQNDACVPAAGFAPAGAKRKVTLAPGWKEVP